MVSFTDYQLSSRPLVHLNFILLFYQLLYFFVLLEIILEIIFRLAKKNSVEELFTYEDLKLYRSVKRRIQVSLRLFIVIMQRTGSLDEYNTNICLIFSNKSYRCLQRFK